MASRLGALYAGSPPPFSSTDQGSRPSSGTYDTYARPQSGSFLPFAQNGFPNGITYQQPPMIVSPPGSGQQLPMMHPMLNGQTVHYMPPVQVMDSIPMQEVYYPQPQVEMYWVPQPLPVPQSPPIKSRPVEKKERSSPRPERAAPPPPPPEPPQEIIKYVEIDKTDHAEMLRLKNEIARLERELEKARSKPERVVERNVPVEVEVVRLIEVPIERERVIERERRVEIPVEKVVYVEPPKQIRTVTPPKSVGVGLSLERSGDSVATYVERIVPGFAADKSGKFAVGDVVYAINGNAIQGFNLDAIKDLTIGPAGSTVTIDYGRGPQRFACTLIRQLPDFTDSSNADAANVLVDRPLYDSNRRPMNGVYQ